MSNRPKDHPEEGVLMRYLDGELPAREARETRRHLEACWQCRTELAELQKTVADCIWYRNDVLNAHLPPPPAPWFDIYREFDRIDGAQRRSSALTGFFKSGGLRWAMAAAAAAVLAVAVFYQLKDTPSVQASAILKKAVLASETRPAQPRRIRIRTKTRQITQVVGEAREVPAPPDVETLFQAARYDSRDPLSAKAYQAWRDALAGTEREEVATVPDPRSPSGTCYLIRTEPRGGALASASLTLRTLDFAPVESRLEFRNTEWLELSEVTEPSTAGESVPETSRVEAPPSQARPSPPAAVAPGAPAPISNELQALTALHRIGADLGDPVEVRRESGRVLVSGIGIPAERQKQIRQALEGVPNVSVAFSDPVTSAAPPETAPGVISKPPAGRVPLPPVEARLEEQLGGRAEFEKFSARMLDSNEAAMSRAYALRALAQRFPASMSGELSASDRQTLLELCREHADALARQAALMRRTLSPILVSLGGVDRNDGARAASAARDWQTSAEEILRSSRRVELLLSGLLGVVADQKPKDTVPSDLLSAMHVLEANVEHCRRILSEGAGR